MPIAETHFKVEYLRIDASEELAGEFKLPSLEPLLQRNYETWTKEKAHLVLHSESFIPIRYIEGNPALLDQTNEPWPGGHWHQLKTVGIEIDRLSHSISAAQPTTRQRQDWNMEPGVPLLLVRTRSIDTQNRVVEVSTSIYPADRTTIGYVTQLSRWPDTSTNTGEMSL
jgi:GntR family transcriptional regulator